MSESGWPQHAACPLSICNWHWAPPLGRQTLQSSAVSPTEQVQPAEQASKCPCSQQTRGTADSGRGTCRHSHSKLSHHATLVMAHHDRGTMVERNGACREPVRRQSHQGKLPEPAAARARFSVA